MNPFDLPPLQALLDLAYAGLMALTDALAPLTGATAAAAAVVLVTLGVRARLIPVGISQAKAEQGRARLAPKLTVLRTRFRRDPDRLRRETMELYRREGVSPLAGCLPVLAQAPVVGLLYALFLHGEIAGHANTLLTETLLGVPLGTSLVGSLTQGLADGGTLLVCGGVVLIIAAVGEATRRLLPVVMPTPPDSARDPRSASPDFSRALTGIAGPLQFATAVIALFVPLAAGLYLAVTVSWTLGQRVILRRVYPLDA